MARMPTNQSLLVGLPEISVRPGKTPSIREGPVPGLSKPALLPYTQCTNQVPDFRARLMHAHGELHYVQARLHSGAPANTGIHPRSIEAEEDIEGFLVPEVIEPAIAILRFACPDALVWGVPGFANGHANYFLVASIEVDGGTITSAVCVEIKTPYGADVEPTPLSMSNPRSAEESDTYYAVRTTGMPTLAYGELALGDQLRTYVRVRAIAHRARDQVGTFINRDFGILTDFNRAWVARFRGSSLSADDDLTESLTIEVSQAFHAANGVPRMAFVYAFVMSEVISDMRSNPDKYRGDHVRPHRRDPRIVWTQSLARQTTEHGRGHEQLSGTSDKDSFMPSSPHNETESEESHERQHQAVSPPYDDASTGHQERRRTSMLNLLAAKCSEMA
ncbi:hypothetical protein GGF43_002314, partial [Coemansia sp. RSA 2618]